MSDPFQIPVGKHDWITAIHDIAADGKGGDRPLALMLHGFPGDRTSYGDVLGGLSKKLNEIGFDTLRFDFRGCGDSRKRAQFFTLQTANEDAHHVLKWAHEKMGHDTFVIVAEGLGALIALTALTDHWRPRVPAMALLWPVVAPAQGSLASLIPRIQDAERSGADHVAAENALIGLNFLREVRDYKLQTMTARITMPAQIHFGVDDRDTNAEIQAGLIRDGAASAARLEIVGYVNSGAGLKTPEARSAILAGIPRFLRQFAGARPT